MGRCVGWYCAVALAVGLTGASLVRAEGDWEITADSQRALARGLHWLADPANQGLEGNWESQDLGLVSMGLLAFLSDGHAPGRGPYGEAADRALRYLLAGAGPDGLLNVAAPQRDMYNHGLSTFVLGQAHGMASDERILSVLDQALRLIIATQCQDGGWDYRAQALPHGHDLSLMVMQAKALRSAVDTGFTIPPAVIQRAIVNVRRHYTSKAGGAAGGNANPRLPGQFTYTPGGNPTVAMAAAGVVCLQEFGQYDDWRIPQNMDVITAAIGQAAGQVEPGKLPMDPYTLYYVGQALYQVGGDYWRDSYPVLRDAVVRSQIVQPGNARLDGVWQGSRFVGGKPGDLYSTSVACFILAMPNRYLPILQEGRIEAWRLP